jgi:chromate transporter
MTTERKGEVPPPTVAPAAPSLAEKELVTVPVGLGQILWYFLNLGTFGFGGPIALAGYMQRDLVERRRWITRQDYVEGLAFSQLCPGPLAAQLAMYLGWVRAGALGATLSGLAFIGPSFLMVLALAALYLHFEGLTWVQGLFYGIGAAVIAIIARSAYKLVRLAVGTDWLLGTIFVVAAVVTVLTESEVVWVFLLGGVVVLLVRAPPRLARRTPAAPLLSGLAWLYSGLRGPADSSTLSTLLWYFTEAGAFVFGSGLAVVPFLHSGAVERFGWLDERQFLDAVAVAMITPGPVVITAGFIGYLVAGPAGAAVASLGVFLPPYLLVLFLAPYYRRFAQNRQVKCFVQGVTAAATGAITGSVFILGRHAVKDLATALIALVTLGVLLSGRKVPEPLVILAGGAAGLMFF